MASKDKLLQVESEKVSLVVRYTSVYKIAPSTLLYFDSWPDLDFFQISTNVDL